MQRRSFLSLSAAAAAASALGQSGAPSEPVALVLAGADRTGTMHSMAYSALAYKVVTRDSRGDLFMMEHHMQKRGGPPLHVHPHQEETFYVLEGEFVAEVGGKRFALHPGDTVCAPRNVPHAWACVGDGSGKLLIAFTPSGKMESFFDKVCADHALLQDAALFREHDMVLLGATLAI
jgi:quercetin dioxygenase-like cupin family protein